MRPIYLAKRSGPFVLLACYLRQQNYIWNNALVKPLPNRLYLVRGRRTQSLGNNRLQLTAQNIPCDYYGYSLQSKSINHAATLPHYTGRSLLPTVICRQATFCLHRWQEKTIVTRFYSTQITIPSLVPLNYMCAITTS